MRNSSLHAGHEEPGVHDRAQGVGQEEPEAAAKEAVVEGASRRRTRHCGRNARRVVAERDARKPLKNA